MPGRNRPERPSKLVNRRAFLNIPYDAEYEPLLLAFVAGLCSFGLIPKATLQLAGSQRRLSRILGLIRRCRFSFHDLSRVELDPGPPPTPRFNMPFELGLCVALATGERRGHRWFVFDAVAHRTWKSLSDLAGTDVYVHGNEPVGVLRELANALHWSVHQPTVRDLEAALNQLQAFAIRLKQDLRTESLFEARAFNELVYAAQALARRRRKTKSGAPPAP
jgi:hypothetical protein